jgi:hypothetical protein
MALRAGVQHHAALADWAVGQSVRIASGFYTSQALELRRVMPAAHAPHRAGHLTLNAEEA